VYYQDVGAGQIRHWASKSCIGAGASAKALDGVRHSAPSGDKDNSFFANPSKTKG
jgi:hypothetical protein